MSQSNGNGRYDGPEKRQVYDGPRRRADDRSRKGIISIPTALAIGMIPFVLQLIGAVWYFSKQDSTLEQTQVALLAAQSRIEKLESLIHTTAVPSALNSAEIASLKAGVSDLRAQVQGLTQEIYRRQYERRQQFRLVPPQRPSTAIEYEVALKIDYQLRVPPSLIIVERP